MHRSSRQDKRILGVAEQWSLFCSPLGKHTTMSQQEDKKPRPAHTDTAAANDSGQTKPQQTPQGKDPDEYDPVGMAGKKAGILLELGEEASDEEKAKQNAALPKEVGEHGDTGSNGKAG
jgi:hypothetical protein